jgi:hypothetical protein
MTAVVRVICSLTGLRRIGYPRTIRCTRSSPSTLPQFSRCWRISLTLCGRVLALALARALVGARSFAPTSVGLPGQVCCPLGSLLSGCLLEFGVCASSCASAWVVMASPLMTSHAACLPLVSFAGAPEVGDERHLVFACPALEHIRLRYRHFFTSRTDTMVQFLWQDDLLSVARFIADCFDHFQSGGAPS